MKKLEDVLLQLKFDTDSNDYSSGQKEAIKFCIRKHEEGWTLDDFYKELYNALSMNVCSEYVQRFYLSKNRSLCFAKTKT